MTEEVKKSGRYTEAQKRSTLKYAKQNLKRIPLDVQLEHFERIKAAAEKVGEPVNTFIKTAIDRRIESGD